MFAKNRIQFPIFKGGYLRNNHKNVIFKVQQVVEQFETPFVIYGKQVKIMPKTQLVKNNDYLLQLKPIEQKQIKFTGKQYEVSSWNCVNQVQIGLQNSIMSMDTIEVQLNGQPFLTKSQQFIYMNNQLFKLTKEFEVGQKIADCNKLIQVFGDQDSLILLTSNQQIFINQLQFKSFKQFAYFTRSFMPRGFIYNTLTRLIQFQRKLPVILTFEQQIFLVFGNILIHMFEDKVIDYHFLYPHFYNKNLQKYIIQSQSRVQAVQILFPFLLVGYTNSFFEVYLIGSGYNGTNRQPLFSLNLNIGQILSILPVKSNDQLFAFIAGKSSKHVIFQQIHPDPNLQTRTEIQGVRSGFIKELLPISINLESSLIIHNSGNNLVSINLENSYQYIQQYEFSVVELLEKPSLDPVESAIIFNQIQLNSLLLVEAKLYQKRAVQLKASNLQAEALFQNFQFLKLVLQEEEILDGKLFFLCTGLVYISNSDLQEQQLEYSRQRARDRQERKIGLRMEKLAKTQKILKQTAMFFREKKYPFFDFLNTTHHSQAVFSQKRFIEEENFCTGLISQETTQNLHEMDEKSAMQLQDESDEISGEVIRGLKQIQNETLENKDDIIRRESYGEQVENQKIDNLFQSEASIETTIQEKAKISSKNAELSDIHIETNQSNDDEQENILINNNMIDSGQQVVKEKQFVQIEENIIEQADSVINKSKDSLLQVSPDADNKEIENQDANEVEPIEDQKKLLDDNEQPLLSSRDDKSEIDDKGVIIDQKESSSFNPHLVDSFSSLNSESSSYEDQKPEKFIPLVPFVPIVLTTEEKAAIEQLPDLFKFADKETKINDDTLKKVDANKFGFEQDYLVLSNYLQGVAFGHDYAGDQIKNIKNLFKTKVRNTQQDLSVSNEYKKMASYADDDSISQTSKTSKATQNTTCTITHIDDESTQYTYEEQSESSEQLGGATFIIKNAQKVQAITSAANQIEEQIQSQLEKEIKKHKQAPKKYIKVKKLKQSIPTFKLATRKQKKKRPISGQFVAVKVKKSTSTDKIIDMKKEEKAKQFKNSLLINEDIKDNIGSNNLTNNSQIITAKQTAIFKPQVYKQYQTNFAYQPNVLTTVLTQQQLKDSSFIQSQIQQLQELQKQYQSEINFEDLSNEIGTILGGNFRLCQTPQIVPEDDKVTDFGYTFLRQIQPAMQGVFTDSVFLIFDPKFFPKDEFSKTFCTVDIYDRQFLMPALMHYFKKIFTDFYSKNIPKHVYDLYHRLEDKGVKVDIKEMHIYPISFIWSYLLQFNAKGIYDFYSTQKFHFQNDQVQIPMGHILSSKSNLHSKKLIETCNFILFKSRQFWQKVEKFASTKSTEILRQKVEKPPNASFDEENAMKTYEKLIITSYQKGGIEKSLSISIQTENFLLESSHQNSIFYCKSSSIFVDCEREFDLEGPGAAAALLDAEVYNLRILEHAKTSKIVPYSLCAALVLHARDAETSAFIPLIHLLKYHQNSGKTSNFYEFLPKIFEIEAEKIAKSLYQLSVFEMKIRYQKLRFPAFLDFEDIAFLKQKFERGNVFCGRVFLDPKEQFFLDFQESARPKNVLRDAVSEYQKLANLDVQKALRLQKLILRTYNQVGSQQLIVGDVAQLKTDALRHLACVENGEIFEVQSDNSLDEEFSLDDGAAIQLEKRCGKFGGKLAQLEQLKKIGGSRIGQDGAESDIRHLKMRQHAAQDDLVNSLRIQQQTLNEVVQNEYVWYDETKKQIEIEKRRILSNAIKNAGERDNYRCDVSMSQKTSHGMHAFLKDPLVKKVPVKILKGIDRK
ncbi:hypothetical protein SS50377_24196 [Spironucleus salmonicida]|uniref:Uncharacterized protein n=1 Tax=Spironucleus salmonicida TaxID=348837 RepID=V6LKK0_9EUKA|nr:hypothetical protein SS50377_24196 [Spironucleus salmonicida]|eukprot:EST44251.1 Hypothetical protein SS50377_15912 [Spironucleus salmonicida]